MFVKIYQYHIEIDKIDEFLEIQEKAASIYNRYIDFHTIFLHSKHDQSKWLEITRYKDEMEYQKSIKIINEQKEIQELFESFQSLLVRQKKEITEEDFLERKSLLFM
ncbi:hypothetical protein ACFSO7_13655 [Bacillus sp. CGMCC 1.16607]|uniref:hypothetical protein n=1 Tax=Bacillus sp. CGMCC 1.16607 TaxID=3351842 RepID=UPI003635E4AE